MKPWTSGVLRAITTGPWTTPLSAVGLGMVMRPDVIDAAVDAVADRPGPVVYLSPRGAVFDRTMARRFAAEPGLRCSAVDTRGSTNG